MHQFEIDPTLLRPNPWNTNQMSPENEAKLETSISRFGMFKPIVVRELDDGSLEIIGGEHRALIAQRMGMKAVPVVNVGKIDDRQAQEISLVDNGRYGSDDTISLAELLKGLGDEVSDFMPYSESELDLIMSSLNIDLDDLDLEEENDAPKVEPTKKPTKTHTIMRFKVPLDDAERISKKIADTKKLYGFVNEDDLTNAGDALVQLLLNDKEDYDDEEAA